MSAEKLKELYMRGGCTAEQLRRYVALGMISETEREEIVGGTEDGEQQ